MNSKKRIAVIGAGSWGTAIAGSLSSKGYETLLWGHHKDSIEKLLKHNENRKYLPGLLFNKHLLPTIDIKEALRKTDTVCMVVPSHGFRTVFQNICQYLEPQCHLISAVKGIENVTLMTMTQVMVDILAKEKRTDIGSISVLSGPSFAQEVAKGLPTAVTIGCKDINQARKLQKIFSTEKLRVYTSSDIVGIEICAALKNVIAIAVGISDGIGYGLNARAAIITRGLAEITRLGMKIKAEKHTFSGLSGIGDLVLTCTGDLSRNRNVGIKIGKGIGLDEILKEMDMVAEGIKTTVSGYDMSRKFQVEMPILEQVYKILYEKKNYKSAVTDLFKEN